MFVVLVGQRKKSQKYFDLLTFNYNLYDSNPCSSLGVMNFQKWELFSGSPGSLIVSILLHFALRMWLCALFQKDTCSPLQVHGLLFNLNRILTI